MASLNLGRVRGSMWYIGNAMYGTDASGTVFPSSEINEAYENDLYLDVKDGNVYQCIISGKSDTAKWSYQGTIKGNMPKLVDTFDSTSTTRALTANAGRVLYEKILRAGMYTRTVIVDCTQKVYAVKLMIENKATQITITDEDGNEGIYTYPGNYDNDEIELVISIGPGIGLTSGVSITKIQSSEAYIIQYGLYGDAATELCTREPSIWNSVIELAQNHEKSVAITETGKNGEKQSYLSSKISMMVDAVRTMVFPITHAKAVWWNKQDNITVFDKIEKECIQEGDEITDEEIDEIIGNISGGDSGGETPNPSDEITDEEIDNIINDLF